MLRPPPEPAPVTLRLNPRASPRQLDTEYVLLASTQLRPLSELATSRQDVGPQSQLFG